MIPQGLVEEFEAVNDINTSKTYKLVSNKIQGFTDNLEALQQAIYKVLSTEKYEYPIYSFHYGIDLESLIGKNPIYVKTELKRRIRDCLLQDERIKGVDHFQFAITGDELLCGFNVVSIYGNLEIQQEVSI